MNLWQKLLYMMLFLVLPLQSFGAKDTWEVATVEWPPFMCQECPEGGAAIQLLRLHLKSMDADLKVYFSPWSRALKVGKSDKLTGAFPLWPETFEFGVGKGYIKSEPVLKSPVVLIFPAGKKLKWKKLIDLKGYRAGYVQDYGNTEEFNELVKKGVFKSEVSIDEVTNVKKVAAGRVDFAIIDKNVIEYLLRNDLKELANRVEIDPQVVELKTLHFAFNKYNLSKVEDFNRSMKKRNYQAILDNYFRKHLKTKMFH